MLDWNPTNPHVSGRDNMVRMIKNKNQNTYFNHFINHYNKYSIHFILKFHLTSNNDVQSKVELSKTLFPAHFRSAIEYTRLQ